MRWLIVALLFLYSPSSFANFAIFQTGIQGWQPLKLGNGGVVTKINIASDGTMVSTTDTFGCYLWNGTQWQQLLTSQAMPAGYAPEQNEYYGTGCDDIQIDPSNTNNIWFIWNGGVFKSTNKGQSFIFAPGWTQLPTYPNTANGGSPKTWGPYLAIDPNNSNVVYVSTNARGLYRTTDGGATFSQVAPSTISAGLPPNAASTGNNSAKAGTDSTSVTVGTGPQTFSNNSASFGFGVSATNFVQVWETSNPTNQMFGYVTAPGTSSFAINVTNAQGSGTHTDWSVSFQNAVSGGHRVVFDNSGPHNCGSGSNQTCNVFVHTYNIGTWKSTDGGSTWPSVNATNKPTGIRQMEVDPFGVLWVADDDYSTTNIDKLDGATWTSHINPGNGSMFDSVAVDPANCSTKTTCHVVYVEGGSTPLFALTSNSASSWNIGGGSFSDYTFVSSGDVDWLLPYFVNQDNYFGSTGVAFDPIHSGRLYMGTEGVWYSSPPSSGALVTLTQQSKGIEEFIAIKMISPVSGSVFMTAWDFPCFYSNSFNAYPSAITCQTGSAQAGLVRGYSVDWVWNAPQTMVSIVQDGTGDATVQNGLEYSGITTTGGATAASWTKFVAPATTTVNGCIAASDTNHIVWTPAGGIPQITTNGGSSWAPISIPGGTPSQLWGPNSQNVTQSKMCESDKGNGDIYLYNPNNGTSDEFYKYTQAGGWTAQGTLGVGGVAFVNEQLKSVPGQTGSMFFTPGFQASSTHPANVSFYYTINGWTSNATVTGFKEVLSFGFGATWSGQSYPGVYVAGWYTGTATINGVSQSLTNSYGIYMCKGFNTSTGACTTTWAQIGTYPTGALAPIVDMDADKGAPGQVYVFGNGGAYWGRFN